MRTSRTDVAPEALVRASDPVSELIRTAVLSALDGLVKRASRRKRLFTVQEAAKYLGIGPDAVKNLHALRKVPSVPLLERKMLFDIEDLDRMITNG